MDRRELERYLDDLKTDVLEIDSERIEAEASQERWAKRAMKAEELLLEGLRATLAFEHYCNTYPKHALSPRLKKWIDGVRTATGANFTYEHLVTEAPQEAREGH